MTVDEIVSAIRTLPVAERLRVIELVAHETVGDVPAVETAPSGRGVTLTERHGLLIVDADTALPADVFDHRVDRETRAAHIWGGS